MWTWMLTSPLGRSLGLIVIGTLLAGAAVLSFNIWLSSHDNAILKGYVAETRAVAAEAERDRYLHDLNAMKVVADAYQVQYKNSLEKIAAQDMAAEAERAAKDESNKVLGKSRTLDDDDIRFLVRPRH